MKIKDLYIRAVLSESAKNELFRELRKIYIMKGIEELELESLININNEYKFFKYLDNLPKK